MNEQPITYADLDEIERLDREATSGPWEQTYAFNNGGVPTADFKIPAHSGGATVEMLSDDAVFIVRARTLLPRLAAEHRAASDALTALGFPGDGKALAARIGEAHADVMQHLTIERPVDLESVS